MRSFLANRTIPPFSTRIHPALTSFADEVCGTLARLVAYVGALALLAIAGVHLWDQLPAFEAEEASAKPGWSEARHSYPAFAVSQFDLPEKTETYEIFRHPDGGRKDVFRWTAAGEKPVAELQIYRPGAEFDPSSSAATDIAARMDGANGTQLEAAGVIDSKFGQVALLRLAGDASEARSCLGFLKRLDDPALQISGWSCQGNTLPARRTAISCMLGRLMLLTAANDPKLAELFARAELKRGDCAAVTSSADSADWVTDTENPRLRSVF
jgi:hypothetical protein